MKLRFNQVSGIDTQTGAIVQVEATRTHTGGKETDAEVVLSLFPDADDCGYHTTLSAEQTKELIKRLQSLYEGIKAYNEELHGAREVKQ
ncbi:MAG: hypothetical protein ACOYJK_10335 [Prevotella sp.]|jgi:hypothetical protein